MAKLESRIHEVNGKRLTFELPEVEVAEMIIVGRAVKDDNVRPDVLIQGNQHISRKHCAFYKTLDGWCVEDLGSRNGTFLRDKQLSPLNRYPIKNRDEIRLGDEKDGESYLFIY